MATRIQIRRDTAANWISVNPILAQGEIGLELDTGKIKFGDGINVWTNIEYSAATPEDIEEIREELEKKADRTDLDNYRTSEAQDEIDNELSGNINTVSDQLGIHAGRTDNPHGVTKAQVGLGNVDNTSDLNKPVSTATQEALDAKPDFADIPTKTSQLQNTGDGTSKYATENYVALYGGKIDKIQKNGVDLPISNKTVNVTVPTNNNELTNGAGYQTASNVATKIDEHDVDTEAHQDIRDMIDALDDITIDTIQKKTTNFVPGTVYSITQGFQQTADLFQGYKEDFIDPINAKIPLEATSTNKLADKAFVNSSVAAMAADFCGNFANWAAVPTTAEGYKVAPGIHDYMVVEDVSDYPVPVGEDPLEGKWRFVYTGDWTTLGKSGWEPAYSIGSAFTAAQQAAIDSGINSTMVNNYVDPTSTASTAYNTRITAVEENKRERIRATSKMYGTDSTGADSAYSAGANISFNNGQISVYGVAQQIVEFPEPTAANVGMIAQYMGDTTETLTHGFMYEVVPVYTYNAAPDVEEHFVDFTFDVNAFKSYGDGVWVNYLDTHDSAVWHYTGTGRRSYWYDPNGERVSKFGLVESGFNFNSLDSMIQDGDRITVTKELTGYAWVPYAGVTVGNDKIEIKNNEISAVNVVPQYTNPPMASAENEGMVIQNIGGMMLGMEFGHFYESMKTPEYSMADVTANNPDNYKGLYVDFGTFYQNYLQWLIILPDQVVITFDGNDWTFDDGEMTMGSSLQEYGIYWNLTSTPTAGDTLTVTWTMAYNWVEISVQSGLTQYREMPDASMHYDEWAQYIGGGLMNRIIPEYTAGYIYHAEDVYDPVEEWWTTKWVQKDVQPSGVLVKDVMPTVQELDDSWEGKVVLYTGIEGSGPVPGHFYICVRSKLGRYTWMDMNIGGGEQYTPVGGKGITVSRDTVSKQDTINLSAPNVMTILAHSAWDSNNQITVTFYTLGITSSSVVIVSPVVNSMSDWVDYGIKCISQSTNTLTFSCDEVPEADVAVNIVVLS